MNVNMLPAVLEGSYGGLILNLVGGAGYDLLRVNAPNVVVSPPGHTVFTHSFDVNLIGGSGPGLILADIDPQQLFGALNVSAVGGATEDGMNVTVQFPSRHPLGDFSSLTAHEVGGRSANILGLFITPRSIRRSSVDAWIAGGEGFNLFGHTSNVRSSAASGNAGPGPGGRRLRSFPDDAPPAAHSLEI